MMVGTAAAQNGATQGHILLPQEPKPNLGLLKPRLIAYHDCKRSDCYEPEVDRQCERAIRILRQRVRVAKPSEKLALLLDIDETALSNWVYETKDDFAYIPRDFNEWVSKKQAPAIPGTLRVYKEARALGVFVFFLTGRNESQREDTAYNLMTVGYDHWEGLLMKPSQPSAQTTIAFRSAERHKLDDQHYRMILSIGDQMSDLLGEYPAEVSIKLPNPFYYLP
jgi:acid phosphatase